MKKQNLFILLIILVSSLSFVSCNKDDEVEGSIYGIVTTSGEPLKGIGVSLFLDDALLLKTVTYDDGSYEFTNLKPGYYILQVEDEEYEQYTTTVVVESGRQARADMKLSVSYGSIYGIITLTGDPLKGVGVSLFKDDALLLKTVTTDDGSYEFKNLKVGKYKMTVEDERYDKFTTTVVVEGGRQARTDIKLTEVNTYMTVSTGEAKLSGNSVKLYGKCTYGSTYYQSFRPNEYGFYYGTSSNPSQTGKKVTPEDGYFQVQISNLTPGTYYYQAYARNSIGITYGDVLTFSISGEPVVQTLTVSDVTETSAILNGEVVYEGSPAYTERGFIYSVNYVTPTITEGTVIKISGLGEGKFSYKLTGLTKNETYYARAYVKSGNNVSYGDVVTFKLESPDYAVFENEGLMVMKYDLGGYMEWSDANSICKSSRVGGFNDWRLPTRAELSMVQRFYIDGKLNGFQTAEIYQSGWKIVSDYWTSEYYGKTSYGDAYYYVSMSSGSVSYTYSHYDGSPSKCFVRAVRTITK